MGLVMLEAGGWIYSNFNSWCQHVSRRHKLALVAGNSGTTVRDSVSGRNTILSSSSSSSSLSSSSSCDIGGGSAVSPGIIPSQSISSADEHIVRPETGPAVKESNRHFVELNFIAVSIYIAEAVNSASSAEIFAVCRSFLSRIVWYTRLPTPILPSCPAALWEKTSGSRPFLIT